MHFDPAAANRAIRLTRQHVESGSPEAPTVADPVKPQKKSTGTARKPFGIRLWLRRVLRPAR